MVLYESAKVRTESDIFFSIAFRSSSDSTDLNAKNDRTMRKTF